jgi:hypothetical protein
MSSSIMLSNYSSIEQRNIVDRAEQESRERITMVCYG